MAKTAKVESYCIQRNFGVKHVSIDGSVRACIHCIWYEQYYHQNRGNIQAWVPTCFGYCLLHTQQRGALRQPCKDYETKESCAPAPEEIADHGPA